MSRWIACLLVLLLSACALQEAEQPKPVEDVSKDGHVITVKPPVSSDQYAPQTNGQASDQAAKMISPLTR